MERTELLEKFSEVTDRPDYEIDVARAALLLSASEYPDISIDQELFTFQRIAGSISSKLLDDDDPLYCMNTISEALFDEGGSAATTMTTTIPQQLPEPGAGEARRHSDHPRCRLHGVGRRLKVPLVGIGMPGHFLVRHQEIDNLFVDPFNGGYLLSKDECKRLLEERMQGPVDWDESLLSPVSNREIVAPHHTQPQGYLHARRGLRSRAGRRRLRPGPGTALSRESQGPRSGALPARSQCGGVRRSCPLPRPRAQQRRCRRVHAIVAELRSFLED